MSCLWQEQPDRTWLARSLFVGRTLAGEELALPGVAFLSVGQAQTAVFARPGVRVRVNGEPVLGGLRLLEHKDEVLVGVARLVFSSETTPQVKPFAPAAGGKMPICPVCRGPVKEGMAAVECPGCGRWFHQLETKACWTYAPTCRFCNHPTSFAKEACWRPDREESLA